MKTITMQKSTLKIQGQKALKKLNQSYITRLEWYKTSKWKRLRRIFLENNNFCVDCGAPATVCDHVDGHNPKTWKDTFWTGPFQPMCASCHSRKTALEDMKKPKRLTATEKAKLLAQL